MLLQLGEVPRARQYISQMDERLHYNDVGIQTGHVIADAVINQKFSDAKRQQIDLMVTGTLDSELAIDHMDLCALLSNSLDNAIEACSQIEEHAKRKIRLALEVKGGELSIYVENTMRPGLSYSRHLRTSKKDKRFHGIGMTSMRTIVEKYQGHLKWESELELFKLDLKVKAKSG